MYDFVMGFATEYKKVNCQFCQREIERDARFKNIKFTCLDCKEKRHRELDAKRYLEKKTEEKPRVQMRKNKFYQNEHDQAAVIKWAKENIHGKED